jgi:hypothetical protein
MGISTKKIRICVRSVNPDVASRTILITRIGQVVVCGLSGNTGSSQPEIPGAVMTFEAQREDHGPAQKPRIHGAVRNMAGFTPIHANSGVFKDERPPFVGMTFEAWFFVRHRLAGVVRARSHAPRRRKRTVRIVTVRADNHPFFDAMLERHRKLRPHIGMAGFAQLDLRSLKQKAGGL